MDIDPYVPTTSTEKGRSAQPRVEDWKREIAEILFARKGLIFLAAVITFLLAALVAFLWPPIYSATGKVILLGKTPEVTVSTLEDVEIRRLTVSEEDVETELEILQAPELLLRAVRDLSEKYGKAQPAGTVPGFLQKADDYLNDLLFPGAPVPSQTAEDVDPGYQRLRKALEVEPVPPSAVISVRVFDHDPNWAEDSVDAILANYIPHRTELIVPEAKADFLDDRVKHYEEELRVLEESMDDAASSTSVANAELEIQHNILLRSEFASKLADLENQFLQSNEEIAALREALGAEGVQYFAFIEIDTVRELALQVAALEAEKAQVLRVYREDSEKAQAVQQSIRILYEQLRNEVRQILRDREAKIAGLEAGIEHYQNRIAAIEQNNVELKRYLTLIGRIERRANLMDMSFSTLMRRREETRLSQASEADGKSYSPDVSILSTGKHSAELVFPKKAWTLLVGLIAGCLIGCTLAFVAEFLDHRVKRPRDIEANLGLPVVGSLQRF